MRVRTTRVWMEGTDHQGAAGPSAAAVPSAVHDLRPPEIDTPSAIAGRVLVIEDDRGLRELEVLTLEVDGWEVTEADDGEAGVAVARVAHPDVIVCDLRLPGLDGLGVLGALKADPSTADIPVLLVTGATADDEMDAAMEAGAHDYVVKPFDPSDLAVRVAAAGTPAD